MGARAGQTGRQGGRGSPLGSAAAGRCKFPGVGRCRESGGMGGAWAAGPKGRTGAPGRRVFARAARRHRAPPRASARRATSQNTQKPICGALSAPHAPAPRLRPLDDLRPKGAEHGSRSRRAGEKPRARGGSGSGGRHPPRSGAPAWPRLGARGPRRGEALEKLEQPSPRVGVCCVWGTIQPRTQHRLSTWTGARRRRLDRRDLVA